MQARAGTLESAPRIVVGIDGSAEADRALRWAVAEAASRGGYLHLVAASWHVVWVRYLMLPFGWLPGSARSILDAAASEVRSLVPDLRFTQEVVNEPAAMALIDASEGAALLVLGGQRQHSRSGSFHAGSVAVYCTRYAHCPVVVVPGLEHDRPTTRHRRWTRRPRTLSSRLPHRLGRASLRGSLDEVGTTR